MAARTEADIDKDYLESLETKLKQLKDPNYRPQAQAKTLIKELAKTRDQQLFELITGRDQRFEDNFVDAPIAASWLQRKVAPQTVAVNKQELLKLVRSDLLQDITDSLQKEAEEAIEKEKEEEDTISNLSSISQTKEKAE
jgi:hypothetical protein